MFLDRPVLQIEITPQMLEAGLDRYGDLQGDADSTYVVEEVFSAMALEWLRQCPPETVSVLARHKLIG